YGDHRDLHSFPTRRSSDLVVPWSQERSYHSKNCGAPKSTTRKYVRCPIHAAILSKAKRSRRTRFLNLRRKGGKAQTSAKESFYSLFPGSRPYDLRRAASL